MAAYILRMILVLCLAFGPVLCHEEEPIHCCVDAQNTVVQRMMQGFVAGSDVIGTMITQTIATDYDTFYLGAEGTVTDNFGNTYEYKTIENFQLGYGWNIVNGTCTSFEFGGDLPGNCVPYDRSIEYLGSFRYMGFVPSQSWRMLLWPEKGAQGILEVVVTEDGCIPVANTFHGVDTLNVPHTHFYQSEYMYNYTRGIDDPDRWFKLPDNCPQLTKNKRSDATGSPYIHPPFFRAGVDRIHPMNGN